MSESDDKNNEKPWLSVENKDDRFLRSLSADDVDPNVPLTLPSGKVIPGDVARAFVAAFERPPAGFGPEDDPYELDDPDDV